LNDQDQLLSCILDSGAAFSAPAFSVAPSHYFSSSSSSHRKLWGREYSYF